LMWRMLSITLFMRQLTVVEHCARNLALMYLLVRT